MDSWPTGIGAITLFVEDLDAAKEFYVEVFGLPVFFEDDNSAVFKFGDTLINLLKTSEAHGLIEPAKVASPDAGARIQFTIGVDDVDAMCVELAKTRRETAERPDGSSLGNPNRQLHRSGRAHLGDRALGRAGSTVLGSR